MTMTDSEEQARTTMDRARKLLTQLSNECSGTADMGVLLCAALMGLIILVRGEATDTMTLSQMMKFFIAMRNEDQ
jgi:hypothetical protein